MFCNGLEPIQHVGILTFNFNINFEQNINRYFIMLAHTTEFLYQLHVWRSNIVILNLLLEIFTLRYLKIYTAQYILHNISFDISH